MDNFDSSKFTPKEELNKPIPFNDDDTSKASVSHSPLNLGGGTAGVTAKPIGSVEKKPAEKIVSTDRISGVKTFFTKLHVGAIDFLDGQITNWLKNNPDITIKRTNTATGDMAGKKTEPSIIITVWY